MRNSNSEQTENTDKSTRIQKAVKTTTLRLPNDSIKELQRQVTSFYQISLHSTEKINKTIYYQHKSN